MRRKQRLAAATAGMDAGEEEGAEGDELLGSSLGRQAAWWNLEG